MSPKSISFKKPIPKTHDPDVRVEQRSNFTTPGPEAQATKTKRFTIDVSLDLHRRIKTSCAMRGENMAEVIRDLLNGAFPAETLASEERK